MSITRGSVGTISTYGMASVVLVGSGTAVGLTSGANVTLDSCTVSSVDAHGGEGGTNGQDGGSGASGGSISINNMVTNGDQFNVSGGAAGYCIDPISYTSGIPGESGIVTYTNCAFSMGHVPHSSRNINNTNVWTFASNTDNTESLGCSVVLSGTGKNTGSVGGYLQIMSVTAISGVVVDGGGNGNVTGITKDSAGATISLWEFSGANAARKVTGNALFKNGKTTLYQATGTATFTDRAGIIALANNSLGGTASLPFVDILGSGLL